MRAGISTACLYPMELEDSLSSLCEMGVPLFEIFINTFREMEPGFVHRLNGILREHCAQVKSIHPFTSGFEGSLFFSDYPRRQQDGLEFYKRYFEAANLLGAEILVLHGQRDYRKSKLSEEGYCQDYALLYELGQTFGVTVAQENVNLFRAESAGFVTRMREWTGDHCAFVLDVKQAVRAGEDPYAMCEAMGERLCHIHLNDNRPGADCLLPGQGTMDYGQLLAQLKRFGYRGDLIMEVYRNSFKSPEELMPALAATQAMAADFNGGLLLN